MFLAAGWGAGWWLNRQLEFEIDGAGASIAQRLLGALVIAAGALVVARAISTVSHARTTMRPDRAASTLVTPGPFRRTRNPIYLGLLATYLGAAIVTNQAWPIVLLPVVLAALTIAVVHREEAFLREAFPEYAAYARQVRSWL